MWEKWTKALARKQIPLARPLPKEKEKKEQEKRNANPWDEKLQSSW